MSGEYQMAVVPGTLGGGAGLFAGLAALPAPPSPENTADLIERLGFPVACAVLAGLAFWGLALAMIWMVRRDGLRREAAAEARMLLERQERAELMRELANQSAQAIHVAQELANYLAVLRDADRAAGIEPPPVASLTPTAAIRRADQTVADLARRNLSARSKAK